jgi:ubiquinone/menaquinone biosynthesis C-methylase UbiE
MENEHGIITRENQLREWFTRDCDPVRRVIDGLDIGWGGMQRAVTREVIMQPGSMHLDIACGYGTFLAQLGWRFPEARLVGLNIDYQGPHACIHGLLEEANVRASLIRADACSMPFRVGVFSSASCFLGLQDIKIGSGTKGVQRAIAETMRVVQQYGYVTFVDEFPIGEFREYLSGMHYDLIKEQPLKIDVKWNRNIAAQAIQLYAQGWVAQTELTGEEDRQRAYNTVYQAMKKDMEQQIHTRGYFVPFTSLRMVMIQRR